VVAWVLLLLLGWAVGAVVAAAHPAFDTSIVRDLHGAPHSALTAAMRAITALGSALILDLVFTAGLATLLIRRSWRNALFLTLASPGTVLMVRIVKAAVGRARPLVPHLTNASGPSWPSGHAGNSAALYGALALIALSTGGLAARRARRGAQALVASLLALIGLSRVYLGVHYLTDVLAAWLLVAGWLTVLDRHRRR
jgi:undecaprenyl-diphosphatase